MREINTQIQTRPEQDDFARDLFPVFSHFSVFYAFLREAIYLQKDHLFLWVPVFFSFGISTYFSLSLEPPHALVIVLLGFISCMFFMVMQSASGAFYSLQLGRFMLCLFLMVCGFSAASLRTALVYTAVLDKAVGPVDVYGDILSLEPLERGKGVRAVLSNLEIEDLKYTETPNRIRLAIRKDNDISVGQRIKILAKLNPPSPPVIPNGFDFRRYLYFQGIGAVGFSYTAPEIIHQRSRFFSGGFAALRNSIAKRIMTTLQEDQAAVAVALIVGKRGLIADEDRDDIRDAGLAHMLAISGLHIGLVTGTLFFLIRLAMSGVQHIALRYPIKKIAAVLAFAGALFYMQLAGATVPTQRAVLTIAVVFLAILLDRSPISLRLVAFSALVVLVFSPESLLSASFHMSFAAVTCLVYFYDLTRNFWSRLYTNSGLIARISFYFTGVCITTLIASVATVPFALYHFGQVSFIGSLSNLAAVPVLAFIVMPFGLLSIVLMPFSLDRIPLTVMGAGIDVILDLARWGAALPYAVFRFHAVPFSAFLLVVFSCLFMILWRGRLKLIGVPFMLAGLYLSIVFKPADILISSSHKLFGILDPYHKILYVTSLSQERFVRSIWTEYYGLDQDSVRVLSYKGGDDQNDFAQCGQSGCRFLLHERHVSFLHTPYAHDADCVWSDVLISGAPVQNEKCDAEYIIDRFDTWRNGSYALWLDHGALRIERSADYHGRRPWSVPMKD